uniref:Gustatory receptor n=1 Tax=Lutzomyia longipalpis TaxID=7200 RepID=A0A7G3B7Y1_LUTLO
MELINRFKFFFTFFRIFGMCYQTPGMSRKVKILLITNGLIQFIIVLTLIPVAYLISLPSAGNEIMNYVQGACILLVHLASILESLLTMERQLNFWRFIKRLEDIFEDNFEEIQIEYGKLKKSTIKIFWGFVIISFVTELGLASYLFFLNRTGTALKMSLIQWAIYVVSVLAGRIRYVEHTFTVELLTLFIKIFNKNVRSLKTHLITLKKDQAVDEFNRIKLAHTFIWETSRSINMCHQWTQFLNVLLSAFQITSLCYWTYFYTYLNQFISLWRKKRSFINDQKYEIFNVLCQICILMQRRFFKC